MTGIRIVPITGVPEITPGSDLAGAILAGCAANDVVLENGDVVCVAQKVVSKSEGALVELPPEEDPEAARRRVARAQAVRIVAETDQVLIVETHHGFVCANAGVDGSNLPPDVVSLLPEDPDASARRLAAALRERSGAAVGVVVTDTFGRPWRIGQTDVAVGIAGIAPLRDERGTADRSGRTLTATLVAVADEIAAAADLARRKADGTPFVLVRGVDVERADHPSAKELIRPAAEDLFRRAATDEA